MYLEVQICGVPVSIGTHPDDQMEMDMCEEYHKLCDETAENVGGEQNYQELMKYKANLEETLIEHGYEWIEIDD